MKPLYYLFFAVLFSINQSTLAADTTKGKGVKKVRTVLVRSKVAKPASVAKAAPSTPAADVLTQSAQPVAPVQEAPALQATAPPVIVIMPQVQPAPRQLPELLASYSQMVLDGLPRIKTVYPTGEKPLVIINLKCPVEVLTGEAFAIPNAMRTGVNFALEGVSNANVLPFNVQLVCS